jgi:hypothetical protein
VASLRRYGTSNFPEWGSAAALRYHARRPSRPLQTIMKCSRLCRAPGVPVEHVVRLN